MMWSKANSLGHSGMIWERGGEWWEWNDKRYLEWDIENKTSKKPRLLVELWKTSKHY